jgi:hypothetical protein
MNSRVNYECGQDGQNVRGFCPGGTKPPASFVRVGMCQGIGDTVGCPMEEKKPSRRELARRRKITKFYENHPEAREVRRQRQAEVWTPERRKAKSEEVKRSYRANPGKRKAASERQKAVMRSKARRKINSTTMKLLKADPAFEARRLAGIKRAESSEERKARRRKTFAKTLAVPAIKKRRLRGVRKATSTRAYREKMSANKQKFWVDLRARLADPRGNSKARNRGGRPRKDELYRIAAALWPRASYREIARQLDAANFAKDPNAAAEKMRRGIKRWMLSHKQETPADEPETLHNR